MRVQQTSLPVSHNKFCQRFVLIVFDCYIFVAFLPVDVVVVTSKFAFGKHYFKPYCCILQASVAIIVIIIIVIASIRVTVRA